MESLTAQLEALKKTQTSAKPSSLSSDAARGAIDFASACAVGSALGFGLDYLLNTTPWCLLGGLMLGVVAGFRMMLRVTLRDLKEPPVSADNKPNSEL